MEDNQEIKDEEIVEAEDELYEHHRIIVEKGQSLLRIDKFLKERIRYSTRNRIQAAIDAETVLVNDKGVKSNYRVKPADVITIFMPDPPRNYEIEPENIPLTIPYEDDELLIVNKNPNMVVHPAHGHWSGTLIHALVFHFQNLPTSQNGVSRPGLVHRIDKDTSGLMVIAKTELAMTHLAAQFFHHTIERTYYALVWGTPKVAQGTIQTFLGRSMHDRKIVAVFTDPEKGKWATTHYKVLKSYGFMSLIQCNLETGRTHQIRVHMKHIGHTLFNDETYGGNKILKGSQTGKYKEFIDNCFEILPRQALHAKTIGFVHPITKEKIQFDSDLPADMQGVIDKLERYVG